MSDRQRKSIFIWPTVASRLLFTVLASFGAAPAIADVIYDRENGPLTGIFGLPSSTEGSLPAPAGSHVWDLSLMSSSHAIEQQSDDERLVLDGETTRIALVYRYGLGERLQLGFELPLVSHQSGSLDSFIDSWHDLFDLPEGNRPGRPRDLLEFSYANGGGDSIFFNENSTGIGDIRLLAGWQLSQDAKRSSALHLGVKLPTGDSETLRGSGAVDISIGIAGDYDGLWGSERLNGFYNASAVFIGEPDLFADRYNDVVGQLWAGLGYRLTPGVELRVQTGLRSALYDSDLENLGEASATITFGGNFRLSDRVRLSFAIGEDIKVSSAPDVTFLLGLQYGGQ